MNFETIATTLGFGALIGSGALIATFWSHFRMVFSRIRSLIIVSYKMEGELYVAVVGYCNANMRQLNKDSVHFHTRTGHVKPLKTIRTLIFEKPVDLTIWWNGLIPVIIKGEANSENSQFIFIRGTVNARKLFSDAVALRDEQEGAKNKQKISRYELINVHGSYANKEDSDDSSEVEKGSSNLNEYLNVYNLVNFDKQDIGLPKKQNPFASLYYEKEVVDAISKILMWYENRDWFEQRGLNWRLGYLFKGPAGTGKSSLVSAIAQLLDLPMYSFDLASMSNEEVKRYWRKAAKRKPAIVFFEDFDRVFHGDKLVVEQESFNKGKLTLDCILNCMSGVDDSSGILTIVTCNDESKLDSALLRGGRLDFQLEISYLSEQMKYKMARRIINGDENDIVSNAETIEKVVRENPVITGANFERDCASIAVDLFKQQLQETSSEVSKAQQVIENGCVETKYTERNYRNRLRHDPEVVTDY